MSNETDPASKKRQAQISTADDGEPIGVTIFLASEQLRALGVDPVETDKVTYSVDAESEQVIIESENTESGE